MPKFVVDEDMPRSTSRILKTKGYDVLDVRDCGLRGGSDEEVFKLAQKEKAVLLTGDLGFGNILHFPIGSHFGVV
jgi:predicted nuclease of predicted toxin-antitoxin system